MPRIPRIVIPGSPHHVTHRALPRRKVFTGDADRAAYLDILRDQCRRSGVNVLGYCLMDDHVHLLAVPDEQPSLAAAVAHTQRRFSRYRTGRNRRSAGSIWRDRFYSCPLDDDLTWFALACVERSPVRAGLVRRAWQYPWSSAAAHCGRKDPSGLLDLDAWRKLMTPADWKACLGEPEDAEMLARLHLHTSRGRPLGGDAFIDSLERALGRTLRARPVGRPRKHPRP